MKRIFSMIAVLGIAMLGFAAPASATGEHPSIAEVITEDATGCEAEDGTISVETEGEDKEGWIYTYDVTPGQDNGYSDLSETETGLAPGEYEVSLLKREGKAGDGKHDEWEVYETVTAIVGSDCVTVDASGECETVNVTFTNTTGHDYFGDVRVDGEAGEPDELSTTVKDQGPEPHTVWGLRYQNVDIPADGTSTHEVTFEEGSGEHTVEYRVARGPERNHYSLAWGKIVVDCGEPEPVPGPPGEDGKDGEDGEDGKTPVLDDVTPASSTGESLPKTGAPGSLMLAVGALLLLALGTPLVLIGRKRTAGARR